MLLNAEAEALAARIVLDELRAGRLANALELLEQTLDTGVLAIDSLGRRLGAVEHERAAASLRVLRDYRQRHPRKPEAAIQGVDEPALRQGQQRVREILHGTK
jgi:hypothetical protein